jgi:hypothetical protein
VIHENDLIATVAVGLSLAFVGGLLAARLGLPPIVGYLAAGVAIGPFTPGFVADAGLASQLAEIGVILLMFGVGLHFSPGDLLEVRGIALPGGDRADRGGNGRWHRTRRCLGLGCRWRTRAGARAVGVEHGRAPPGARRP